MKTIKLFTAAVAMLAALFFQNNAKAQNSAASNWRLGVGVDAGIPTGNISGASSFELGGTLRLQYSLGDKTALTLTSGYYNFFGKKHTIQTVTSTGFTTTTSSESFGLIPLKAGFKSFFNDKLYFGIEAGAAFETADYGKTRLDVSPALGYANSTWDLSARYENIGDFGDFNYGIIGLRLAYSFKL